jgi:(S)-2-hydroxyglutarate dehydrogenase
MTQERKKVVIIGAGIVGLATAYQILRQTKRLQLIVIDKEDSIAQHQTGHNSGVIHSGIYYKPGSLKARNCIEGYGMLVKYCRKHHIPFELCGKIIIATEEKEIAPLKTILERGIANGLKGIKVLSGKDIRKYEPNASGIMGLFVPQTGIVDYKAVSESLAAEIRKMGGEILLGTSVRAVSPGNVTALQTSRGNLETHYLITAAGLYSDKWAKQTHPEINFQIIPFRGEYYSVNSAGKDLVKNLIYPVPDPAFPFLGVHFTRCINGSMEAGPNAVLAFAREGYSKSTIKIGEFIEILRFPGFRRLAGKYWKTGLGEIYRSFSKRAFTRALQKLVPRIQGKHLVKAGAGVRAQACLIDGTFVDDFLILQKGNIIHVCNAPSPAATSSLAIGKTIASQFLNTM